MNIFSKHGTPAEYDDAKYDATAYDGSIWNATIYANDAAANDATANDAATNDAATAIVPGRIESTSNGTTETNVPRIQVIPSIFETTEQKKWNNFIKKMSHF